LNRNDNGLFKGIERAKALKVFVPLLVELDHGCINGWDVVIQAIPTGFLIGQEVRYAVPGK